MVRYFYLVLKKIDKGETGTRFYIILKGSAYVLLPNRGNNGKII